VQFLNTRFRYTREKY